MQWMKFLRVLCCAILTTISTQVNSLGLELIAPAAQFVLSGAQALEAHNCLILGAAAQYGGMHACENIISQQVCAQLLAKGSCLNPLSYDNYLNLLSSEVWAKGLKSVGTEAALGSFDLYKYKGFRECLCQQIEHNVQLKNMFVDIARQVFSGNGMYAQAYKNNAGFRLFFDNTRQCLLDQLPKFKKLNEAMWDRYITLSNTYAYHCKDSFGYPAFQNYLRSRPDFHQFLKEVQGYIHNHPSCSWAQQYRHNKHFRQFFDTEYQKLVACEAQARELSMQTIHQCVVQPEEVVDASRALEKSQADALIAQEFKHGTPVSELDIRYCERIQALEEFKRDASVSHQEYALADSAQQLIAEQQLDHYLFTSCDGVAIQQQAHKELVGAAHESAAVHDAGIKSHNDMACDAATYAVKFAETGIKFNNKGYVATAYDVSDFCHAILGFGKAVALGGCDSVHGFIRSIAHPIQTLKDVSYGVQAIGEMVSAECDRVLTPIAQDMLDKGAVDSQTLNRSLDTLWADISSAVQAGKDHWDTLTAEEKTRSISSCVCDFVSPAAAAKKVATVAGMARVRSIEMVRKVSRAVHAPEYIARTADGVAFKVAQNSQGAAQKAATKTKTVTRFRVDSVKKLERLMHKHGKKIKLGFNRNVAFDACLPFQNIKVTWDGIRHVIGAELDIVIDKLGKKIVDVSGAHHVRLEALKELGLIPPGASVITNQATGVVSVYSKTGKRIKTLFPLHWSQEKVLTSIYEAGFNLIEKPFSQSDGNWILKGKTAGGIEIKFVTDKAGALISAYPV